MTVTELTASFITATELTASFMTATELTASFMCALNTPHNWYQVTCVKSWVQRKQVVRKGTEKGRKNKFVQLCLYKFVQQVCTALFVQQVCTTSLYSFVCTSLYNKFVRNCWSVKPGD